MSDRHGDVAQDEGDRQHQEQLDQVLVTPRDPTEVRFPKTNNPDFIKSLNFFF